MTDYIGRHQSLLMSKSANLIVRCYIDMSITPHKPLAGIDAGKTGLRCV